MKQKFYHRVGHRQHPPVMTASQFRKSTMSSRRTRRWVEDEVAPFRPSMAVMRAGFAQLGSWDLQDLFRQRGCLLKSVPRFLWGSLRICLKIALEILAGARRESVLQQKRGWKLFFVVAKDVPQTPSWSLMGRDKLVARFDEFAAARFDSGQRQVCSAQATEGEGAPTQWRSGRQGR